MSERKGYTGIVISDKMSKTVIVKTMHLKKHAKYGKVLKVFKKFKAHDEKGEAKMRDKVLIVPTRPISKDKHFRVKAIVEKAHVHAELKEEVQ